jgi:outer membrane lipoprotein-sorting protein
MIENSKIDKVLNSDKGIPLKMEDTSAHGEYESLISTKKVHKNPKILDREMGNLKKQLCEG